ncbi:hypothetical protein AALA17_04215 [Lactobacillaceae bacterium 24-114]
MSKISNEQLAHDMAMTFVQADVDEMGSANRLDELRILEENLKAGKVKANSLYVNYHHYYKLFLNHLEAFGDKL